MGGGAVVESERINCHHNFTQQGSRHFGKDAWAVPQGRHRRHGWDAGSYPRLDGHRLVRSGRQGQPTVLEFRPHGAGRNYSRSAARKAFTLEDLQKAMVGIEYRDTAAFIDEIPQAYKNIDVVMADAADLVEVRHTLRQLVNVKGE